MVPTGNYERVMPLIIRRPCCCARFTAGDNVRQRTGAGLSLSLTKKIWRSVPYVCPGKYEYGPVLREVLTRIEQEG